MAFWDNLLKKLVSPLIEQSIKETEDQKFQKGLVAYSTGFSGVPLSDANSSRPKTRDLPRGVKYQTLRDFSRYYPILRACINYRKRQISQLDWGIGPIEVVTDKAKKEKYKQDAAMIKSFFKYPSGDKTMSFRTFMNKVIEDLVVLDAVAIYRRLNRRGGFYGYLPIDSSTIELIVNEDGTTPIHPDLAYVQKVDGAEKAQLTTKELIYKVMNPRTDSPYGMSQIESLVLIVTTALKLGSWNLSYLTEGNVPEGFVELPKDIASDPQQLKLWQEAWDAMFSGNAAYQRKVKFLPEGMKWHPVKRQEDLSYERFEKWLLQNVCAVMDVPPQAIGFQFDRGKGATEAEWEIGKERGLYPMALFLKEIFDEMIQDDLGQEHLQFIWTNINPTNAKEESEVFGQLVRTGAVSVDEWRVAEGYEPIGLGHYIMTPVGPIFAKDFIKLSEEGASPFIPESVRPADVTGYDNVTESEAKQIKQEEQAASNKPKAEPKPKDITDKFSKFATEDVIHDLNKCKYAASIVH
jgi:HK97 family phage portal protein